MRSSQFVLTDHADTELVRHGTDTLFPIELSAGRHAPDFSFGTSVPV